MSDIHLHVRRFICDTCHGLCITFIYIICDIAITQAEALKNKLPHMQVYIRRNTTNSWPQFICYIYTNNWTWFICYVRSI